MFFQEEGEFPGLFVGEYDIEVNPIKAGAINK